MITGLVLVRLAAGKEKGALDAVPAGYIVSETKNGLPVLKKG